MTLDGGYPGYPGYASKVVVMRSKVVLVGDSSTGKSCLLASFVGEAFVPAYKPTVGVDYKSVHLGDIGRSRYTIWDTNGANTT